MAYESIRRRAPKESRVSRPMSKAKVVRSPKEPSSELRQVLRQGGNRATSGKPSGGAVVEEETKKSVRKPGVCVPRPVRNVSADSSCSSDSSSSRSSVKEVSFRRTSRPNVARPVKVVPEGEDVLGTPLMSLAPALPKRRCAWITVNSGEHQVYLLFSVCPWPSC